jgi:PAS domain S-box-containing protein
VIGSDEIWQLLYPDEENSARIRERANEILRDEGEVVGYETWITTRDGRERQLSWNSRSLRNETGELAGSIAIGQDITDIRQAETMARQRERQLATILDSLPGMAYRCLYDEHWTLISASKGCRQLTGYEPDELINNKVISFAELIAEGIDEATLQAVDLAVGNAELFSIEYSLVRKDGTRIWVWECGRSVEGEGELVLEGIVLDISDRKALENELSEMAARDPLTGLLNRRDDSKISFTVLSPRLS